MKFFWLKGCLAAGAVLGMAGFALGAPTTYPTGTIKYDPDKAYNGYLLIAGGLPRLVDMNGNLVREWPDNIGMPNKALPGGRLMTGIGSWKDGQQDHFAVIELDSDGNKLWEFRQGQQVPAIAGQPAENGKTWIARQHHDYQRKNTPVYPVPGQNEGKKDTTLVLAHINEHIDKVNKDTQLVSDIIYEVDPAGKIIWQWKASDHLDEFGFDDAAFKAMNAYPPVDNPVAQRHAATKKPGGGYDWMHFNCASYVGPNKWYKEDPVKYAAFNPDNILFNSRDGNLMGIIDRKTGKIVWRLGPDFAPGTKDFKVGQIIGAHGAHIIPEGLPGAGNLMFFDNGGTAGYGAPNPSAPITGFHNVKRDYSRVVELNPVTKDIVWTYDWFKNHKGILGHHNYKFFSPFVSYAQRLPNGNTMITEGDAERVFEITPDYEMVWEYMSPYKSDTPGVLYRAYRVPYEFFPQLAHAEEIAVIPPENMVFQLPNAKGQYAKTGVEGEPARVDKGGQAGGKTNAPASDGPMDMNSY